SAACKAVRLPLNESGAITIFIMEISVSDGAGEDFGVVRISRATVFVKKRRNPLRNVEYR
ncbi:MAG: hypothetical protein OXT74_16765, partial [Candidatus Poribacteria bacterium]|nr:hypothetical protein [Candidatus Poribacteria bacterium]